MHEEASVKGARECTTEGFQCKREHAMIRFGSLYLNGVSCIALLSLLCGCSSTTKSRASSSSIVPGVAAIDAIRTLEKDGFRCRIVTDGRFVRCSKLLDSFGYVTTTKVLFLVLDPEDNVQSTYQRIDHTGL